MKVELLAPDAPPSPAVVPDASAFSKAVDAAGSILARAAGAEDAYAAGAGSLEQAEYLRAQADVTLAVASAAVQRTVQAVQTLMNLPI